MKRKTLETAVIAAALAASLLTGCSKPAEETTAVAEKQESKADAGQEKKENPEKLEELTVGASPAPHAEILEAAREVLASKGYDLKIVEYTDYVLPNNALDSGDLDANYFQHQPYLDSFNAQNGTELSGVAVIHYEPFGIYAGKSASLDAIPEKGTVLVPNDLTNEARALLLLEAQGLITLKEDAGLEATKNDIVENPKKLKFKQLEAAQLPRVIDDVDAAIINGGYALNAGFYPTRDSILLEDKDSPYINIIAVRAGDENREDIKTCVKHFQSDKVRNYINETFKGGFVPVF